MTTQHDKPKRWRPWQFSLRTILLLMFGVGCFLGGWTANEWQRQRELEQSKMTDGDMMFNMIEEAMKTAPGGSGSGPTRA